jgi:hypothetical protein
MARITINDLPQSDELDREAMRSVLGGGLRDLGPRREDRGERNRRPIVDYPPGCAGTTAQGPKG